MYQLIFFLIKHSQVHIYINIHININICIYTDQIKLLKMLYVVNL